MFSKKKMLVIFFSWNPTLMRLRNHHVREICMCCLAVKLNMYGLWVLGVPIQEFREYKKIIHRIFWRLNWLHESLCLTNVPTYKKMKRIRVCTHIHRGQTYKDDMHRLARILYTRAHSIYPYSKWYSHAIVRNTKLRHISGIFLLTARITSSTPLYPGQERWLTSLFQDRSTKLPRAADKTVTQLVKKFPTLENKLRFIIVFTPARPWFLSSARWTLSSLFFTSSLILRSHVPLGLSSDLSSLQVFLLQLCINV
jgi:hypothetical protein